MTKKQKIKEAPEGNLRSNQVYTCTWKSCLVTSMHTGVLFPWYRNKRNWRSMVLVCGVDGASKQKKPYQSLFTKEKAGSCSKKAQVRSETSSWVYFLRISDVHPYLQLLFTITIIVDKRPKHLLVGSYCQPHFLHSWLDWQFLDVASNLCVRMWWTPIFCRKNWHRWGKLSLWNRVALTLVSGY